MWRRTAHPFRHYNSLAFTDATLEGLYSEMAHLTQFTVSESMGTLLMAGLALWSTQRLIVGPLLVMGYLIRLKQIHLKGWKRDCLVAALRLGIAWNCQEVPKGPLVWQFFNGTILPLVLCPQLSCPLPLVFDALIQLVSTVLTSSWLLQLSHVAELPSQTHVILDWLSVTGVVMPSPGFPSSPYEAMILLLYFHVMFGSLLSCILTYVRERRARLEFWNHRERLFRISATEEVQSTAFQCICVWIAVFSILWWCLTMLPFKE